MKATKQNPIYTVYIQCGSNKYNITPLLQSLDFTDQAGQFSKSVQITIMDIKHGDKMFSKNVKVCDPVWIYANDGERKEEVWRGTVWTRNYDTSADDTTLRLKCYDNLIYLQESEDAEYFSAGQSTQSVIQTFCNKWGIPLEYSYDSITHSKLALRGTLSNIFTDDILDTVKKKTGRKYVVLSEKNVMKIKPVGSNTQVYKIRAGENAAKIGTEWTMDGVTTKVVILGKADDNDRQPVEATVLGWTDAYGTLQKLMNRDENTSLAEAQQEAQSIINKDGNPKWEFTTTVVDIPWIRKGDKIHVKGGELDEYFIVKGVNRDISNKGKNMTLTFEFE